MGHRNLVSLSLALLLVACTAQEQTGSSASSIIGGLPGVQGDFPTTVAITNGGLCTGTLIAPDLVLTAAHCILPELVGASSQEQVTSETQVVLDSEYLYAAGGTRMRAAETIPHPDFSINGLGDNDIALIRLQSPVTDRVPTPINRVKSDAKIGMSVTQVGYGLSQVGGQEAGRLYVLEDKKATSCGTFGASDTNLLCFSQVDGRGKCQGDSGGPSYATINGVERVVGVTSFGDRDCRQFGADTRVDAELDFLYSVAPELQCQLDGECNEVCGNDGLPSDSDCSLCEKDSDCEEEEICAEDGQCIAAPFTPGGQGFDCAGNQDCESNLCGQSASGNVCTSRCSSDDQCGDGLECIAAGDQQVCWPESTESGGCSVGGRGSAPLGSLLLALALLVVGRRRRRE